MNNDLKELGLLIRAREVRAERIAAHCATSEITMTVPRVPEIMRVPEVVALLGVDRKTVYEAVARDETAHRRIGIGTGSTLGIMDDDTNGTELTWYAIGDARLSRRLLEVFAS